jgi:hypothetical protein
VWGHNPRVRLAIASHCDNSRYKCGVANPEFDLPLRVIATSFDRSVGSQPQSFTRPCGSLSQVSIEVWGQIPRVRLASGGHCDKSQWKLASGTPQLKRFLWQASRHLKHWTGPRGTRDDPRGSALLYGNICAGFCQLPRGSCNRLANPTNFSCQLRGVCHVG